MMFPPARQLRIRSCSMHGSTITPEPSSVALGARHVRRLRDHRRLRRGHEPRPSASRATLARSLGLPMRPTFGIEDTTKTYPFAYSGAESPIGAAIAAPHPEAISSVGCGSFLREGRPTDTGMLLMTLTYASRRASPASTTRTRTRPPQAHAQARPRQLPRPSASDDRGAARAGARRAASSRAYLYVPTRDGPRFRGGGSITPGPSLPARRRWVRLDPPTPSSAVADLVAWRWRAIPPAAGRCRASYFGTPTISST